MASPKIRYVSLNKLCSAFRKSDFRDSNAAEFAAMIFESEDLGDFSISDDEIIYCGDKVVFEDPIERWPICDYLIAFHSSGYPLEKAEAYAGLRKPFLVNELEPQHLLHDQRKVYEVGNCSSEFHPETRRVRREGSHIYEEFMPTGGTNVKVSRTGLEYAHAEARKSHVVDGVVMRNPDGKEVHYLLLTPMEKQMSRDVCMAFRQSTKLKSAIQRQGLRDATRMLVTRTRPDRESGSEAEEFEHAEKLCQVKVVLEGGGHFSGFYRKVPLKPLKWVNIAKANGESDEERTVEALMALKYGGVLTYAGRKQAEELGRYFRNNVYPGEGTSLLHLHSTYRHDLKIYSSDEGQVQMSAAVAQVDADAPPPEGGHVAGLGGGVAGAPGGGVAGAPGGGVAGAAGGGGGGGGGVDGEGVGGAPGGGVAGAGVDPDELFEVFICDYCRVNRRARHFLNKCRARHANPQLSEDCKICMHQYGSRGEAIRHPCYTTRARLEALHLLHLL